MPKIIEGIRDSILTSARNQLRENGYSALSLRGVANECGIAVGTTYNYFNSKEALADAVVMEDWEACLNAPVIKDPEKCPIEDTIMDLYRSICQFYADYTGLGFTSRRKNVDINLVDKHYDEFASELTKLLKTIVRSYGYNESESFLHLIAESALTAASPDVDDYEFEKLIDRVLVVTRKKKRN